MAKSVKAGEAYVKLTADSAGLESGVKKSKAALENLGKTAEKLNAKGISGGINRGLHAIGKATVAASEKFKKLGARLKGMGRDVSSVGLKITGAATAVAGGMSLMAKHFASSGDALDKMSARSGASVEWLSAMGYAAERSGAELESIADVVKETNIAISEAMTEAQAGSGTKFEAFQALKLDPKSVAFDAGGNARSIEQQFEVIATALSKVDNQMDKTRIAMDLWGDEGVKLLPMIGNIKELTGEAHKLGIVMSTDQARSAAALTDTWTRVKAQVSAVWVQIGSAIAPVLQRLGDWLSRIAGPIKEWISDNQELVVWVLKGVAALLALGGVITATGALLGGLGTVCSVVGGALSAVASIGGVVAGVLGGTGVAVVALVGGIGYLLASTGALSAAWDGMASTFPGVTSTLEGAMEDIGETWDWVCEGFSDKWSETVGMVKDNFGVLVEALKMGNIKDAWELALSIMRYTWANWTSGLGDLWDSLVYGINAGGIYMLTGLMQGWSALVKWLHLGWLHLKHGFFDLWDGIAWAAKRAFMAVSNWVSDTFDEITVGIKLGIAKAKTYVPGNGYTDAHYRTEKMYEERMLAKRKARRAKAYKADKGRADKKYADAVDKRTEERQKVAAKYDKKWKYWGDMRQRLLDDEDEALQGKMQARRDKNKALKDSIAAQRQALQAKNAEAKAQKEAAEAEAKRQREKKERNNRPVIPELHDIKDNTKQIATNTSKEATSAYNAAAVGVQWSPMTALARMAREARRRVLPAPSQGQRVAMAQGATQAVSVATIGSSPRELTELPKMDKTLVAMLTQLGTLTGNVGRYASGIDGMLRVV